MTAATRRWPAAAAIALAATLLGGCVGSQPAESGQMDSLWLVEPTLLARTEPYRPNISGRSLPYRWTLRRSDSLILSTLSIVQAAEAMENPPAEMELLLARDYTDALADSLASAVDVMEDLRRLVEHADAGQLRQWSQTMAAALVGMEEIVRQADPAGPAPFDGQDGEVTASPVSTILSMLAPYLNSQDGQVPLAETGREVAGLRDALSAVVLRAGFALVGRQLPEDLPERVAAELVAASGRAGLEARLAGLLLESVAEAPAADADEQLHESLLAVLSAAPRALRLVEEFLRQWDSVESVSVELRTGQVGTVLAGGLKVRDRREVRLTRASSLQPAIVFGGEVKSVVLPRDEMTDQTVVLFEPADDSSFVQIRFQGLLWSLGRLFGAPLEDSELREIRAYFATCRQQEVRNVTMLSESVRDRGDGRRITVFHEVRQTQVQRSAFATTSRTVASRMSFSHLTPQRIYSYVREKP